MAQLFVEGVKGINANEHLYLKKMFGLLKVGTEIELEFGRDRYLNKNDLAGQLRMNSNFERFGFDTDGIAEVKGDGSLENGIEIVTNGRFLTDVALFHSQYNKVFNKVNEITTPIISQRTGLHQHFVLQTAGGNTNLEIELNPLFFKNFNILFKNNLAGIFWLTSALYSENDGQVSYTRYDGFHKWEYLYESCFNNLSHEKGNIEELRSAFTTHERYNALNTRPMKVSNNKFTNFHIEFRLSDGAICPAQIAIQNFMFEALIKCALELSLFGELKDLYGDDEEYHDKIIKYKNNPSRENYPSNESRYSNSTEADLPFFQEEAHKLTKMLKPFLDERVFKALNSLCDKNISQLLEDGKNVEEIEALLSAFIVPKKGNFDEKILKHIANNTIDITTLNRAVISGSQLGLNVQEINEIYNHIKENNIKVV